MKKTNITLSIALAAVFSSSVAFAEAEVTGKIVHESGFFSSAGSTIGNFSNSALSAGTAALGGGLSTLTTPAHDKRDAFKAETSAKIYVDGELNEVTDGATYHVELNLMTDGKGGTNYDSNESYTQRDALREAYVDSQVGDWSLRTGKQQVVWGTADGMKLLDMINPTDYGEMAQNQMEDSRIPVWMVNAETTNEDGSEIQVIVSQPRENVFAGLNRNTATNVRLNDVTGAVHAGAITDETLNNGTDTGHAFMMKGPDTITGVRNGFLNIVPDLGSVATGFANGFAGLGNLNGANGAGTQGNNATTVGAFETMSMATFNQAAITGVAGALVWNTTPVPFQNSILGVASQLNGNIGAAAVTADMVNAVTGAQMLANGFAPYYNTNLADYALNAAGAITDTAQNSTFEYMSNTTFATFDSFINAKSQYVYNMPDDNEVDVASRFKGTKNGINYSINASYNYDKNPIIDLSWRGDTGQILATNETYHQITADATAGLAITKAAFDALALAARSTTLQLYDPANAAAVALIGANDAVVSVTGLAAGTDHGIYGGNAMTLGGLNADNVATLQFSQEVRRVKQIGGSFDMAIETEALGPVVIRGEALYTKDGYSPIIDKDKLAIGDLVGALEMVKGDRAKFVLGADITALTNMMISAQFIQDSNLDFVDGANRYTADYATMHMTNGFNKAIKDKNFYSLFFSKPFGASGEHRWNNITMLEEGVNGNGKWNRLDAEFSIDDDTQATVEYNKYWGDANTQFGQLEASSNVQVGVKYSF